MKKDIHPQYFDKATVTCACGANFIVGATKKEIEIETCSQCHPFYTGQERGAVSGGRIEKFQEKLKKQTEYQRKHTKKEKQRAENENKK